MHRRSKILKWKISKPDVRRKNCIEVSFERPVKCVLLIHSELIKIYSQLKSWIYKMSLGGHSQTTLIWFWGYLAPSPLLKTSLHRWFCNSLCLIWNSINVLKIMWLIVYSQTPTQSSPKNYLADISKWYSNAFVS